MSGYAAIAAEAASVGRMVIDDLTAAGSAVKQAYNYFVPSKETPEARGSSVRRAQKRMRSMTGGSVDQSMSNTSAMVPAQLIAGRGGELDFQRMNICKPISFKTGESAGPSPVSAHAAFAEMFKANGKVVQAFAFKMILPYPVGNQILTDPVTRFAVNNIFRHNVPRTMNVADATSNEHFGTTNQTWNETLGPDSSNTRRFGSLGYPVGGAGYIEGVGGTAYGVQVGGAWPASTPAVTDGFSANHMSPYRFPVNGGNMYSRLNMQTIENLGWNANPLKFYGVLPTSNTTFTTGVAVYANGIVDQQGIVTTSLPNQAAANVTVGQGDSAYAPMYRYKSQNGVGGVSYNFHNDGTNPVVIDIVITKVKRNEYWQPVAHPLNIFDAYNQGYQNYLLANRGQVNLNGQPPANYDTADNCRVPFLPAVALKWYKQSQTTGQSPHPFKQVGRDQFIIAGGASRAWSMEFPALNYFAYDYDQAGHAFDDRSYCISIAVSGVPTPLVESAPLNRVAVIDRRGDACNVSVTGAYHEKPLAVYPTLTNKNTFINGALDNPYYTVAPTYAPYPVDIASIGSATRSASSGSAYIQLAPTNTTPGA